MLPDAISLCPTCGTCVIILNENISKKGGLPSSLLIKCTQSKFTADFYTSKIARREFDIDKRITYAMPVVGQGHGGIEKFTHLMDMTKSMTRNNYDKIIKNTKYK